MSSTSNVYCYHPYVNLTIENNGKIRVCCATPLSLGDISDIDNIEEFWYNSPRLNTIREMMRQPGSIPDDCVYCKMHEKDGVSSKRIRFKNKEYFKTYPIAASGELFNKNNHKLIDMDIAFGNQCNLQCATCSSYYSTSWINDDITRLREGIIKPNERVTMLESMHMRDDHILQLIELTKNVHLITVKGGEPFAQPEFFKFIHGISCKESIHITIITNGTIYNQEIIDQILQFNSRSFVISLDGIPTVHNWIRRATPIQHKNIIKNISAIGRVDINTVVSAFNIFTIDKFVEWVIHDPTIITDWLMINMMPLAVPYSLFMFDEKYNDIMIEKLQNCITMLEKSKKMRATSLIIHLKKLINFIKITDRTPFKKRNNIEIFIDNYEKILVPSRGYCLSTIDPLFGEALDDLKKKL